MKNKISTKFMYVILQLVILTVFVIGANNDITLETKAEEIDTNLFLTESVNINESSSVFSNLSPRYQEVDELQQNEVYGSWQSNYSKFNCYSYAIDYIEGGLDEVDLARHPGQMSGGEFDATLPISHTAELVRNDLLAIGYNDVKIYSTMPTVLYYNQKLICVRQNSSDFHFMKYHPDGNFWTHKPAENMVLKYIDELSNDVPWIREIATADGTLISHNMHDGYRKEPYDSDIYYITYDVLGFTIDNNGVLTNYTPPSNFNGNLTIPNVTGIGANAFANLTQLTNVTLPNTVTTIGANAFWGCTNLQNINIPASVTQIGAGAFKGCIDLQFNVDSANLHYALNTGSSGNVNVLYNKSLSKIIASGAVQDTVTIPVGVTEIEEYAFSDNLNLEILHIYGEVTIGRSAFLNCENLYKVYFYSYATPTIRAYAFDDCSFVLYVPYVRQSIYNNLFSGQEYSVQSIPIQITLKVDGIVKNVLNTYYGAGVSSNTPIKDDQIFVYWESENGAVYKAGGTWDVTTNITVNAVFIEDEPEAIEYSIKLFDYGGEREVYRFIPVVYGQPMPVLSAPQRPGYVFNGYYDQENGAGAQYYDANMNSMRNWDVEVNNYYELIAYWTPAQYLVTLDWGYDNIQETITVTYGMEVSVPNAPTRQHYEFVGYYDDPSGYGACYVTKEIKQVNGQYVVLPDPTYMLWEQTSGGTLYARWDRLSTTIVADALDYSKGNALLGHPEFTIQSGIEITLTAPGYENKEFYSWSLSGASYFDNPVTVTLELYRSPITGNIELLSANGGDGYIEIYYQTSCVAEGTLITLADGSQVPVETLTGNEMLLVWNLHTGSFDIAPILFIDSDEAREYQIINLYFSDGTHVKVISEHGFWDFDLNRYVYLGSNAGQYIGHWFNKQVTDEDGNFAWGRVQLINVTLTNEYTTAWSPVTYGHLCLYVNGMLSMPGATGGLVNTFEVDGNEMKIDEQSYLADIATYGLYTYEEFAQEYDVPEEIFNAVQGQYLKVAIGKGLIDAQGINALINSYSQFF